MTGCSFPLMQSLIDTLPSPIITPLSEIPVDGLPFGKVVWKQTPGNPANENVEEGIDDLPKVGSARSASRFGLRQKGLDD